MTLGLAFGALNHNIDLQYVEQNAQQVVSLSNVTPEIILDKFAEYLQEQHVKINVDKNG